MAETSEPVHDAKEIAYRGAGCVVITVFLALFSILLLLSAQSHPDDDPSIPSAVSLRDVGEAVLNYARVYGGPPPAVFTDAQGRPLYSWRVLLLPFLEESDLYRQFKLDEAWESPSNRKLLENTPRCYLPIFGGDDPPGTTRYQVFVGPGTPFEHHFIALNPLDFPDGLDSTFLVVEAAVPVPWTKPDDLIYDPNGPLPALRCKFKKPVRWGNYNVGWKSGFNAAFADGKCRFISEKNDDATLRALITRNGGEKVDLSKLE
jgi:hypothetical protein